MKTISLTQGKVAIVDDEDYELVSQYKWYVRKTGKRWYAIANQNYKKIYMHRLILGLKPGDKRCVDHINGDCLNNRKHNIRICTHSQNGQNRGVNCNSKSGLKGVWRQPQGYTWWSQIGVKGKYIYLGTFATKEAAAEAYNSAAQKYFGEYAYNGDLCV